MVPAAPDYVKEPKIEPPEEIHEESKLEPLECSIPLHEPKLEPSDEMEWTQPKIEPIDDFETDGKPLNKYQEILEYHFEEKPGIIDDSQPSTSSQDSKTEFGHFDHLVRPEIDSVYKLFSTKTCTLCFTIQHRDKMRGVSSKMQRTILIVARLLEFLISMEEAKELMSETHHLVCETHFAEAVGILDASYGKMELRNIVRELRPAVKFGEFIQAIQRFQGKQGEKIQHVAKVKPVSKPTYKPNKKTDGHCSLCSKCQPLSTMSEIPNVDHIVMDVSSDVNPFF